MGRAVTRGLRGDLFEELINKTNAAYMDDGLAVVQKLPTPIRPLEMDPSRGVITLAYFGERSTVDYMGHAQGVPICFDAKETGMKSLPLSNIREHQIEFMGRFHETGGLSFLLVSFTRLGEIYLLDFESLKARWDLSRSGGRKSIPAGEFRPEYRVSRSQRYLVHYLDAVSAYFENKTRSSRA